MEAALNTVREARFTINETTTLYAQWETKLVSIKLNGNGGKLVTKNGVVTSSITIDITFGKRLMVLLQIIMQKEMDIPSPAGTQKQRVVRK